MMPHPPGVPLAKVVSIKIVILCPVLPENNIDQPIKAIAVQFLLLALNGLQQTDQISSIK